MIFPGQAAKERGMPRSKADGLLVGILAGAVLWYWIGKGLGLGAKGRDAKLEKAE